MPAGSRSSPAHCRGFRRMQVAGAALPFQGKRLVLLFSNDLIDIVLIDTDERNKAERVDLIFAHNDVMAIAAAAEAEEKKSEAAVISVGGYDLRGSDLEAVKDGRLNAAVFCPTGGREAVQLAVRIIREKELPPETVYLEPVLVTAENVDEYLHAEEVEG